MTVQNTFNVESTRPAANTVTSGPKRVSIWKNEITSLKKLLPIVRDPHRLSDPGQQNRAVDGWQRIRRD